jgi:hypothetical protein
LDRFCVHGRLERGVAAIGAPGERPREPNDSHFEEQRLDLPDGPSVAQHPEPRTIARLRSLAGEHGYTLDRGPVRDTWILTSEKTGEPVVSPRGTTAFNVKVAIGLLKQLSVDTAEK